MIHQPHHLVHRRRIGWSTAVIVLAAAVVAALLGAAPTPLKAQEVEGTGAYGGEADTQLAGFELLGIPDADLTLDHAVDVRIAPSRATVDSAGLEGSVDRSLARAANLDAGVLFGELIDEALFVEAQETAPPDNAEPTVEQLGEVPADPLLNASLARAEAHARWLGDDECLPDGEAIAEAESHLADARILTDVPEEGGEALALHNEDGETVHSLSRVGLIEVDGQDTSGVRSTTTTQVTAIELFDGELTVNVLATPTLTATATGAPGGATVDYTAPVLQVLGPDGEELGTLDAADANLVLDEVSPAVELRLGALEDVIEADDGTHAAATATLLSVDVLNDDELPLQVANLAVGTSAVSATAPEGGVVCASAPGGAPGDGGGDEDPLGNVSKESSSETVQPGDTFTYTITIPNDGACTLTDVRVVDEIEGPAGSSITATDPEADEIDGLTATWEDVGPILPGQSQTLAIDVAVPDDAAAGSTYREDVTVTADCDGATVEGDTSFEGPVVPRRAAGPERVRTSVEVSREAFERADTVILARSDEFPDALAASTLAAEIDGPILLNPPATLDEAVSEELDRLGTETVYLAGGVDALSVAVNAQLQSEGYETIRLSGPARYETAARIAEEVVSLGGAVQQALLARDDVFADAMAAGNLATYGRAPILITPTDELHPAAHGFLTDDDRMAGDLVYVAGGSAAISPRTESQTRDAGFTTRRLAGAERYGTAVAIVEETIRVSEATLQPMWYASGADFSDALVAAPAAHQLGGALMLVAPDDLDHSAPTRDFTRAHRNEIGDVVIVGGRAAISDRVVEQIYEQLNGS